MQEAKISALRTMFYIFLCLILLFVGIQFCWGTATSAEKNTIANFQSSNIVDNNATNKGSQDFNINLGIEAYRSRNMKKAREIFDNILKVDGRNSQAQYFLGLIEYEEGNTEKAKIRFQIAYDCLSLSPSAIEVPIDNKKVQLEVSDKYEALVYYKDGWFLKPKRTPTESESIHSLDVGSTYRIEIKPKNKDKGLQATNALIGSVILLSFLIIR